MKLEKNVPYKRKERTKQTKYDKFCETLVSGDCLLLESDKELRRYKTGIRSFAIRMKKNWTFRQQLTPEYRLWIFDRNDPKINEE